jgi:predicted DNA-binding transcriptional regulator AlpA
MRFLDHDAVNALTGPRSAVQRWRDYSKNDAFPRPVFTGGRKRWTDYEVASYLRWIRARRDAETAIVRWSEWWALDRQRAEIDSARDRHVGDAPRSESTELPNPA